MVVGPWLWHCTLPWALSQRRPRATSPSSSAGRDLQRKQQLVSHDAQARIAVRGP
jgi:hypothetical protein